jgi:TPP-dependent pyruvate/acetoin dehydrogenase alpha subunit
MGTSVKRGCAKPEELFRRGEVFGIPGKKLDGMNLFEVKETTET